MGQRKLFIALMRAELEDSIEGLEQLSGRLKERLEKGEITNYVFNENGALLSREISGLKALLPFVDAIKSADYPDVRVLAQHAGDALKKKAEEWEDPEAVGEIIARKIRKILKYILELPE
jgi:hypothetical protein